MPLLPFVVFLRQVRPRRFLPVLCLLPIGVMHPALAGEPKVPGIHSLAVAPSHREHPLDVDIWYPADPAAGASGHAKPIDAGAVFQRERAVRDAQAAEGRHPVVLLSHGGLRAAPHLGDWLAARLAERGIIVVSVQPPRLPPDEATKGVAELWLRPADLSLALTAALADPLLTKHAAANPIGMVGVFRGGTAALMLAGARLDAGRAAASCDGPARNPDCRWFAAHGVDLHAVDRAALERPQRDERIKWAIAVFPEMLDSFDLDSLATLAIPVEILGGDPLVVNAAPIGKGLSSKTASRITVDDVAIGSPFDAFPVCVAEGAAILKADGDDGAICASGGLASRLSFQDRLTRRVFALAAPLN